MSSPSTSEPLANHEQEQKRPNPVFPDFESSAADDGTTSLEHLALSATNACGGDPLGSPPHTLNTGFAPKPESRSQLGRGFRVVSSTAAEVQAAQDFYDSWTSNEPDGQKQHATAKSTVFSFMQYRDHPDTGTTLMTQEQWDGLLTELEEAGVLDRDAAIWHDLDEFPDGTLKPLHFHGAIKLKPGMEKQVRFLSIRAKIPASRIRTPGQTYAEGKVVVGRLAGEIAFFDLCEYLVHEDERSRYEQKYQYPRDEVRANFDFSEFLDAGRPAKAKRNQSKVTDVDRLAMRIMTEGLTLDEAMKADPLAFNKGEPRMKRARVAWVQQQPQPAQRINIYFYGEGGLGKDANARALARQLVPGDWIPGVREPFFIAGSDNVLFEGYDGEPVVIFEEVRAVDLVMKLGRSGLFSYLNPFPGKQRFNVKNASALPTNVVTIMTGPQDYRSFLDGLAGRYTDKNGVTHEAEKLDQAYRRFPLIIPVRADEFDVLVNRGFLDGTNEFREYYSYRGFRQSMRSVLKRVNGIADPAQRTRTQLAIEARQVAPTKAQFDAVVSAVSTAEEDPDALLAEFADVGQKIAPEVRDARAKEEWAEAQRQADGHTAHSIEIGSNNLAWVDLDGDHPVIHSGGRPDMTKWDPIERTYNGQRPRTWAHVSPRFRG